MAVTETLTSAQFDRVAALAKTRWGLSLTPAKAQLVTSRLASFLRRSEFSDAGHYLHHLETAADEADMLEFFDLLSTNVTSFFRDRMHFDYLERELLTGLARGTLTLPGKRMRLWSAGCSTGCEPYSLAMIAYDCLQGGRGWDVQVLATDLSNYAVHQACAAHYTDDEIAGIPRDARERHFERCGEGWGVKPHIRSMVKVARLNLMDSWPMKGPFDVIFCRNVMIYFDAATREKLVRRFVGLLRSGGVFAVGSAESLAGMNAGVRSAAPSLYVK